MLLAEPSEGIGDRKGSNGQTGHCTCSCHEHGSSRHDLQSDDDGSMEMAQSQPQGTTPVPICRRDTSPDRSLTLIRSGTRPETGSAIQEDFAQGLGLQPIETNSTSAGKRPEVARILSNIAEKLGTASPDRYNDYEFKHSQAAGFPVIPGEENRNRLLLQIKEQWGQPDMDGDDAQTPRGRSRANSFNGEDALTPRGRSRAHSFNGSPSRSSSPQPPKTPARSSFLGLPMTESPKSSTDSVFPARPSAELEKMKTHTTVVTLHSAKGSLAMGSPAIVLSSEEEPGEGSGSGAVSEVKAEQRPP